MGVHMRQVTQAEAQAQNLPRFDHALVTSTVSGAPAGPAGIRAGDVIVSLNGEPVSMSQFREKIAGHSAGDTVTIEVSRGGLRGEIDVTLSSHEAWQRTQMQQASTAGRANTDPDDQLRRNMAEFMAIYIYTEDGPFGDLENDGSAVLAGFGMQGLMLGGGTVGAAHGLAMHFNLDFPLLSMADDDRLALFEASVRLGYHFDPTPGVSLYGVIGPLYANAYNIDWDYDESDFSLSPEIGAVFALDRTGDVAMEAALRLDSMNDIIDQDSLRVGFRLSNFYFGMQLFLDADNERDLRLMIGGGF